MEFWSGAWDEWVQQQIHFTDRKPGGETAQGFTRLD